MGECRIDPDQLWENGKTGKTLRNLAAIKPSCRKDEEAVLITTTSSNIGRSSRLRFDGTLQRFQLFLGTPISLSRLGHRRLFV